MCQSCDYMRILESSGVGYTENRLRVLEVIGNSTYPLSAQEIYTTLKRSHTMNRVTIYRILDLLVGNEIVDRISAGDRSFRYGLAANSNHPSHPHFFCRHCGNMECLNPESLAVDVESFQKTFPALIQKMEVRLDGICKNCLRKKKGGKGSEKSV